MALARCSSCRLRTQPNAAHLPVEVIEVCSEAALQLSAKPQRDDGVASNSSSQLPAPEASVGGGVEAEETSEAVDKRPCSRGRVQGGACDLPIMAMPFSSNCESE
jgi:hypothetical protein